MNALRHRASFQAHLDRVLYAATAKDACEAFRRFRDRWQIAYPTTVAVLERDLASLLRFYH